MINNSSNLIIGDIFDSMSDIEIKPYMEDFLAEYWIDEDKNNSGLT